MKILALRVINSSRHRKCFVRGYMHSFFVSKALTRSFGFLTQTTRAYNPVRRTSYDVNYISVVSVVSVVRKKFIGQIEVTLLNQLKCTLKMFTLKIIK